MKRERRRPRPMALRIAMRAVVAIPMLYVGLILIYGLGAGYWGAVVPFLAIPSPFNVVVSAMLLVVLLVALFMFVVPDPGP